MLSACDGPSRTGGSLEHTLHLESVGAAALAQIFGIVKAVQRSEDPQGRRVYLSLFATTTILLVDYVVALMILVEVHVASSNLNLHALFVAGPLLGRFVEIGVIITTLWLIDWRRSVTFPMFGYGIGLANKRRLDYALLAMFAICAVACAILTGVMTSVVDRERVGRVGLVIGWMCIAFYTLLAFDVVFSCFSLQNALRIIPQRDACTEFVCYMIAPLLVVRALFKMSIYTTLWKTPLDADLFDLMSVIFEGGIHFVIIAVLLKGKQGYNVTKESNQTNA